MYSRHHRGPNDSSPSFGLFYIWSYSRVKPLWRVSPTTEMAVGAAGASRVGTAANRTGASRARDATRLEPQVCIFCLFSFYYTLFIAIFCILRQYHGTSIHCPRAGLGRVKAIFSGSDPGPQGRATLSLALAPGRLDPGPVGSGQGRPWPVDKKKIFQHQKLNVLISYLIYKVFIAKIKISKVFLNNFPSYI